MPTAPFKFRRANPVDKEAIQRINADAYVPAYMAVLGTIPKPATEDYGTRIEKGEVWILEVEGEPTGVAVLEERAEHLLVYSIAVKPDAQRKGAMEQHCLTLRTNEPSGWGCAKCAMAPRERASAASRVNIYSVMAGFRHYSGVIAIQGQLRASRINGLAHECPACVP